MRISDWSSDVGSSDLHALAEVAYWRGAPRPLGRGSIDRPGLQHFDEAAKPGVRLVAVDDAVVDGEGDVGHRTDLDGVDAADLAHHDALLQLSDAEDGGLGLVDDDRSGEERARDTVIGDGEGAALHVGAGEVLGAGLFDQSVEAGGDALQRQGLHPGKNRDNQPLLATSRADADVDVVENLQTVGMPTD